MKSKFGKFKYQLVESTHKSFQEVLVSFEYKEKPCHYYAFIKERAKMSKKQYIDEAKEEIKNLIASGDLEKRAKQYLNYKVKGGDASYKTKKVHRASPWSNKSFRITVFACLAILVLCGASFLVRHLFLMRYPVNYPALIPGNITLLATILFYLGIGLGALAVVFFIVNSIVISIKARK